MSSSESNNIEPKSQTIEELELAYKYTRQQVIGLFRAAFRDSDRALATAERIFNRSGAEGVIKALQGSNQGWHFGRQRDAPLFGETSRNPLVQSSLAQIPDKLRDMMAIHIQRRDLNRAIADMNRPRTQSASDDKDRKLQRAPRLGRKRKPEES